MPVRPIPAFKPEFPAVEKLMAVGLDVDVIEAEGFNKEVPPENIQRHAHSHIPPDYRVPLGKHLFRCRQRRIRTSTTDKSL
jgi:hypothetical protein